MVLVCVERALSVTGSQFVLRDIEGKTEEKETNRKGRKKITPLTHEQKQKSVYVMVGGREGFD